MALAEIPPAVPFHNIIDIRDIDVHMGFHGGPLLGAVAEHDNRVIDANFGVHHSTVGSRESSNLDRTKSGG
ncbi:MAG: hypothetical protein WBW78_23925 [Terrimicrobiaceae bacterium]